MTKLFVLVLLSSTGAHLLGFRTMPECVAAKAAVEAAMPTAKTEVPSYYSFQKSGPVQYAYAFMQTPAVTATCLGPALTVGPDRFRQRR